MEKVDFKKTMRHLYLPSSKDFELIEIPPMNFLMIDGKGNPNTSLAYQEALEALYSMSYTLKFASKNELGRDYTVPPLEGLWWAEDMESFIKPDAKDDWLWTSLMMVPDWITPEMVDQAREQAASKRELPALERMRFELFDEGLSVQILHIGPFSAEGPTIARLHQEYLPQNNLKENGHHHEIYLSDPRRVAPEKLRTVLRQPVRQL